LGFSIARPGLVLALTALVAALGVWSYRHLPIDAVPDITNVQVQINTAAPGMTPLEVERLITYPLETALGGLPGLEYTRSLSRYGLSQVTVVFKDGTDIYLARNLANERLQEARDRLPRRAEPSLGPIATGLGEIYMYVIEADPDALTPEGRAYSPYELRTLQDYVVRPQLRNLPGVVEVNTLGGMERQYHVMPDPKKLMAYGLTFEDLAEALDKGNRNAGAGHVEINGEQRLLRLPGRLTTPAELLGLPVGEEGGIPTPLSAVAEIAIGHELRSGAATENGREVVLGTVMMLMGENSREVAGRVAAKMKEVNRSLPPGVTARPLYDRTALVDLTLATVRKNLWEGALLVIAVLFILLGHLRAALIVACVIPLAMLFTLIGMVQGKVSANLMSLGALDFGLIIDGSVIVVENCLRRLSEAGRGRSSPLAAAERLSLISSAAREVIRPGVFGIGIILIVYLPLLALSGVEGKMFRPMALTVILALIGALILTLTFIPAALTLGLGGKVSEKENRVVLSAKRVYAPALRWVLAHGQVVWASALVGVLLCGLLTTRMGREFIPTLDEGDIAMHAMRIPGTGLEQSVSMQHALEKRLREFPEVKDAFAKIGTAEVANDPMPPNVADGFIMLKPRAEWPDPAKSKADLIAEIQSALRGIPGNQYEFTQPIQMRFNELIAGVRSDVAVKCFGDDMDTLVAWGEKIEKVLREIPGASDVKAEQVKGLPMISILPDRLALARYGVTVSDMQAAVSTAMAGEEAGAVYEGDKRIPILVILPEKWRRDTDKLMDLPIPLPVRDGGNREYIPLQAVAAVEEGISLGQISREMGKRRLVVTSNVRGRDLGSFVEEAQARLQDLRLPAGYWIEYGGQFEQMISASKRMRLVVPAALLMIFLLLYSSLRSIKDACLVFTAIPLAMTGGVLALWLRGIPLSISAGVGFIALSGVAVLNGLVMIAFYQKLRGEGLPLMEAVWTGSLTRLRPVLMTALVAALGFVPMAFNVGTGAEVQRPLATVVIGGILSSTALTLLVLPLLYVMAHGRGEKRAAS